MNLIFDLSIFIYSNFFVASKWVEAEEYDHDSFVEMIDLQISSVVRKLQKEFTKIDMVYLAADSKNFRVDYFGDYKHRQSAKADKRDYPFDRDRIADSFNERSYDVIKYDGLEADDILWLFSRLTKDKTPTCIITCDGDQMQSIDVNTFVYDHKKHFFYNAMNTDPLFFTLEKILLGCRGDNVPRVVYKGQRFGPKKLAELYDTVYTDIDKGNFLVNDELPKLHEFIEFIKDVGFEVDDNQIEHNINLTHFNFDTYHKLVPGFDKIIEDFTNFI